MMELGDRNKGKSTGHRQDETAEVSIRDSVELLIHGKGETEAVSRG